MGITEQESASLDASLKQLNLSNEEVDKFAKAFKDPEFIKLFEEYAKEVSDPKVKAETDAYLRQLEIEGRVEEVYGKGAELILPVASHVVKTHDTSTGGKVFINICTSDKVRRATLKSEKRPDGTSGRAFECPLCLGPRKEGADKSGGSCLVWDFVVNPDTLDMAARMPAIKRAVVENAMDNIEANFAGVTLQRDWKYPKTTYQATESCPKPHALALRGEGGTSVNGKLRPKDGASPMPDMPPGAGTPSAPPAQGAGSAADAGAGGRSEFSFGKRKGAQKNSAAPATPTDPTTPGYVHSGGEVTPQWEVVHRGNADLADAWGDAGRTLALTASVPRELVVRVVLPGMASAAGVELDVSRRDVALKVPARYELRAPLPFDVDSDKGRAKFDKGKSVLEVTLPVLPPPLPPMPAACSTTAGGDGAVAANSGGAPAALVEELPAAVPRDDGGDGVNDREVGSGTNDPGAVAVPGGALGGTGDVDAAEAAAAASARAAAAAHAAAEAETAKPTANEVKWREMHEARPSTSTAGMTATQLQPTTSGGQLSAQAAPVDRDAVPPVPPPPAVTLQPRLHAGVQLADDLD